MRFMIMHKMTEELERGGPPDPEIIAGIDKLIADAAGEAVFLGGEGLKPTSQRVHIAYKAGKRTITDGPFTEAKELVGGYALMQVKSKEEAIHWCDRFAAAMGGDIELFMGPVVEPWDLGIAPKPENPPLRMLAMHRMLTEGLQDTPPNLEEMSKMGALIEEMTKQGVLQATSGLSGTKNGARIHFEAGTGKARVTDGPFAESKELVAGFAILELPSKEAAIKWALRFGEIVRVHEVEVRQVPEWA